MNFNLLPETDFLFQVLMRPGFAMSYVTMAMVLLGVTYFMENTRIQDASTPAYLVHGSTYFDIFSYTCLLSAMVYFNSFQITRTIAIGQSPRISLKRLQSLPWPVNLIVGSYGDRSIIAFVIQCLCFPGLMTVVVIYGLSLWVNGPERVTEWRMPLRMYLASSMLWRLLLGSAVYTLNYLAAHNPTQLLLIPPPDTDELVAPASTKEKKKN